MQHGVTDSRRQFGRQAAVGLLVAMAVMLSAGCTKSDRPPLAEVEGVVTLDGRPLVGASVLFLPDNGLRSSLGATNANGRYSLIYLRDIHGAVVGKHTVKIFAGDDKSHGDVPAKYNANTTLTAEVRGGVKNQCNFPLTSDSPSPQ